MLLPYDVTAYNIDVWEGHPLAGALASHLTNTARFEVKLASL